MSLAFEVSTWIPVPPAVIYHAWLSSSEHARMTGSPAQVSSDIGGEFITWDGYIEGTNLELEPPRRILQRWRTSDFSREEADSLLEILLVAEEDGTRLTILHSELPDHGLQYQQGWIDAYFSPMKTYFGRK